MAATLADLAPGRRGRILSLDHTLPIAERLAHLGLLEGTVLEVLRRAPAGDPIEIRVAGFALSLRRSEAVAVRIEELT
jgi:ferrous iron transport protein A